MTRVVQAAGMVDALRALDVMLGAGAGYCPIWHARGEKERELTWHDPLHYGGSGDRLARFTRMCDEEWSDQMEMGLPRQERSLDAAEAGTTLLWVRVEGKEQLKRARYFKPLPTMVLCEGQSTRRLLLWWVRPLDYFDAWDCNRKLAYKFGAVQKYGAPERLRIPLPGTCLRVDRKKPVPIVVSRLQPELYDGMAITARLRKPPEVDYTSFRKANNK